METQQQEKFSTDDYAEMPINHKAKVQFRTLKVGYRQESYVYAGIFKKKIANDDVTYIADKITRHFKLPKIRFKFSSRKREGGGTAYGDYNLIVLSYNTNFGTLCHEINHFICHRIERQKGTDRIRHGTKKWNRNFQRIMKYCIKKNYWEGELAERKQARKRQAEKFVEQIKERKISNALKSLDRIKSEPTQEDIKKKKIAEIEGKIKGYQRRIKLYQTKVKKAGKKLKRLQKR
jgi:hypothetical protein